MKLKVMDSIENEIKIGSLVKLKSNKTNSTYRIEKLYKNFRGEFWAECLNIESNEIPEHPISDLELFEEN